MGDTTKARPLTQWWTAHPLEGAGISLGIGILFTVGFFFVTQKERDIRFAGSASPTTIVRAGQSSDLRVSFKDKELTSDVSSIQIAIWNNGKESVRQENILSGAVTLKFRPSTRILEARVKRLTRSLIDFKLDTSESAAGVLHCSWNILEHGDGALLEIIYVGNSEQVMVTGDIEGKVPIQQVMLGADSFGISTVREWVIAALLGILAGIFIGVRQYRTSQFTGAARKISAIAHGGMWGIQLLVFLNILYWIYVALRRPSIPFAF